MHVLFPKFTAILSLSHSPSRSVSSLFLSPWHSGIYLHYHYHYHDHGHDDDYDYDYDYHYYDYYDGDYYLSKEV